jgi:hypothetical protein
MNMKNLLAACLFCGIALTLSAQQSVPPPPQPATDAPANAGVLKLLRQGLSARVVLHGIAATPGKFDTSAAALTALKQAGANEDELSAILAKGGAASAEQPPAAVVPAAPVAALAASSPTLAETMKFIQDKLNDNNKTSWIDYAKPTRGAGSGWIDTVTHEFSSVVADTGQCRISYHIFTKHSEPYRWLATSDGRNNNGKNNKGEDISFSLRSVQEIVVKPWEQYETEWLAKNGHPDATVISSAPATTALVVRQPHGVENVFTFDDAALADRVAKAMVHSVELCGGGKSEEPF